MTASYSDYVNALAVYKREIWYDLEEVSTEGGKKIKRPVFKAEPTYSLVTNATESGTIYDFNVANNRYYEYLFRFVASSKQGDDTSLIEGFKEIRVPIRIGWNGWTLTELHEVESVDKGKYGNNKVYTASLKDVWKFRYNISPGDITQNISKTEQETLSQFPKFIHGPKNGRKGQVSCLLGKDVEPYDWSTVTYTYGRMNPDESMTKSPWEWSKVSNVSSKPIIFLDDDNKPIKIVDDYNFTQGGPFTPHPYNAGGYSEELWPSDMVYYSDRTSNKQMDLLNHWQEFCYSGNPKLLKDQVGNKYIVQIHDPSAHIEEGWEKRPITISFSWTQIGDADDCQILKED